MRLDSIAAYLRVASLAVASYDYLVTLPVAWRLYRRQWQLKRLSLSGWLFVLIRATSILVLTISNIGYFYGNFTLSTCRKFFLIPSVFKVLQVMVSQAIVALRVYNLSRRSRKFGLFLLSIYLIACALQWFTTFRHRSRNCRSYSENIRLGAWIYYVVAIVYDLMVTVISAWFLLKYRRTSTSNL
ncbi:hypothetical protein AMATHDRAFT_141204 [Amanita thiersii Skay4041]|uniref:Uncharacterized protein n=1 Tax=Amanita thiersii Skay4041 TaxID=703135 RepID=A0A2A9NM49_9AGAR|nr:hypothetical protein AMATHDRAFT_141204 [Amanita thiersii Skay4041]